MTQDEEKIVLLREISEKLTRIAEFLARMAHPYGQLDDPGGPLWSCGHRHLTRTEAIECKRSQWLDVAAAARIT